MSAPRSNSEEDPEPPLAGGEPQLRHGVVWCGVDDAGAERIGEKVSGYEWCDAMWRGFFGRRWFWVGRDDQTRMLRRSGHP